MSKILIMMFNEVIIFTYLIWFCVSLGWPDVSVSAETPAYKELQELGISCPTMDTCKHRTYDDLNAEHSCSCFRQCVNQDNCCIDSKYVNATSSAANPPICSIAYKTQESVLMVNRCASSWAGKDHVKELCECDSLLLGDPVEVVPVTNPTTGVTYKNYFCALCNHDGKSAVFWDVKFSDAQNTAEDVILSNDDAYPRFLTYDSDSNQWVQRHSEKEYDVVNVVLIISKPVDLLTVIPECRLDMITRCPSAWKIPEVRRKCESYAAAVVATWTDSNGYRFRTPFRNAHCAICNGVKDFSDATCTSYYIKSKEHVTGKPELIPSVTIWFGHLLWERKCLNEDEIYVELLRGCRTLVCLNPRYVIRNGRCVPP